MLSLNMTGSQRFSMMCQGIWFPDPAFVEVCLYCRVSQCDIVSHTYHTISSISCTFLFYNVHFLSCCIHTAYCLMHSVACTCIIYIYPHFVSYLNYLRCKHAIPTISLCLAISCYKCNK